MRKELIFMKTNLKMKLKNVLFLLVLLKMCLLFGQNLDARKRIVIDVGHGGKDSGAIGINGIQEKDVVLKIALEILQLNALIFDDFFDLYLTRYDDRFISLANRGLLTKSLQADYFVSIHCNAGVPKALGMEVYIPTSQFKYAHACESLGSFILKESVNRLGIIYRGIKFANFQVLRDTMNVCPTVLIEVGFITNSDESNYFFESKNIRAIALTILMGLYQQISYNP